MSAPRFPMRGYWIWLAIIVAFTAVPMALLAGSSWLGELQGCTPNWKMGSDCPPLIQDTHMWSFLAMALTIWVTFIGLPIWLVALVVNFGIWHRTNANRNRPESRP